MKALDTPSHTPPGAEGWRDVLQLLKEQNGKMERLARALSVIQQCMLRNNLGFVKYSVNEATEVLSGMLNTHKMPPRKRGGNPEETVVPPRLKKDGYLPEIFGLEEDPRS